MNRLCILFFCILSINIFSQTVTGIITDENLNPLSGVLVVNMESGNKVSTNINGEFSIQASLNTEVRFVRSGYERQSKIINPRSFTDTFKIILIRKAQEIQEVEIKKKLTGNIKADNQHLGRPKEEIILDKTLREYNRQKSDASVMQAKRNEFVQPKGQGFETTKIGYKWEIFDFFLYLEKSLGDEYFYSLGLTKLQIQPFVFYVLTDFEKKEILRFGYCSPADLGRFQVHAEIKIVKFKNSN